MNIKQLKALRKSQHTLMAPLRGHVDAHAWEQLNDYISSVLQLVKETNNTTENRLLVENKKLKRLLAEQKNQHQEELARTTQTCSEELTELAKKLSGAEDQYRKRLAEMEEKVANLEHINTLAEAGMIQLNESACTSKALEAAKRRFSTDAPKQLLWKAIYAIARSIDTQSAIRLAWADLEFVPYPTDNGWNVFICYKGELSTMPTVLTVKEHALKRALS